MGLPSYTLLLCDCAASQGQGSDSIGKMAERGFSPTQLRALAASLTKRGVPCDVFELTPHCTAPDAEDACAIVIHAARLDHEGFPLADAMLEEVEAIQYDKFTFTYQAAKAAHSRHLVFVGDSLREPVPEEGTHTVLAWDSLPACELAARLVSRELRSWDLKVACALHYPDIDKCGISWHGDQERRQTVLFRLGKAQRPIHLRWMHENKPAGPVISIPLAHGDVFIPCAKAVGTDYKRRKVPTLRHATGYHSHGPHPLSEKDRQARKRARAD